MTLLQAGSDAAIVSYLVFAVIGLLVYVAIARWIFRIDTNTKYNKQQVDLLARIAMQDGVPVQEVYRILGKKIPKQAISLEGDFSIK